MLMGEIIISLFALIALLIFGGVAVTFWITIVVFKAIFMGILRAAGLRSSQPVSAKICTRSLCRADNPLGARFCRRCGKELSDGFVYTQPVQGVAVR